MGAVLVLGGQLPGGLSPLSHFAENTFYSQRIFLSHLKSYRLNLGHQNIRKVSAKKWPTFCWNQLRNTDLMSMKASPDNFRSHSMIVHLAQSKSRLSHRDYGFLQCSKIKPFMFSSKSRRKKVRSHPTNSESPIFLGPLSTTSM